MTSFRYYACICRCDRGFRYRGHGERKQAYTYYAFSHSLCPINTYDYVLVQNAGCFFVQKGKCSDIVFRRDALHWIV